MFVETHITWNLVNIFFKVVTQNNIRVQPIINVGYIPYPLLKAKLRRVISLVLNKSV